MSNCRWDAPFLRKPNSSKNSYNSQKQLSSWHLADLATRLGQVLYRAMAVEPSAPSDLHVQTAGAETVLCSWRPPQERVESLKRLGFLKRMLDSSAGISGFSSPGFELFLSPP